MLFKRSKSQEADEKVKAARFQVDMAILKLEKLLDDIETQTEEARETLHGRRTG